MHREQKRKRFCEGAQTTPSATEGEAIAGSVAVCENNPDNGVSPFVGWSETNNGAGWIDVEKTTSQENGSIHPGYP